MSTSNETLGIVEGDEKEVFATFRKQQCSGDAGALDATQALEFYMACKASGLNPARGEIYYQLRNMKSGGQKMSIQTSIDGFRGAAAASGRYNGQTETKWCGKDGIWKDVWTEEGFPFAAKIGVYIKDVDHPTYATAHFNEYYPKPSQNSKTMPALMIAKCAEALALRKALPERLSRIYTSDEMKQADHEESPAGAATTPIKRGAEGLAEQIKSDADNDAQKRKENTAKRRKEAAAAKKAKNENAEEKSVSDEDVDKHAMKQEPDNDQPEPIAVDPDAIPEELSKEEQDNIIKSEVVEADVVGEAVAKFDEDPSKELFLEAMRERGHKNKAIAANFKAWLIKHTEGKKEMDELTPDEMTLLIVMTRLAMVEDDIPF